MTAGAHAASAPQAAPGPVGHLSRPAASECLRDLLGRLRAPPGGQLAAPGWLTVNQERRCQARPTKRDHVAVSISGGGPRADSGESGADEETWERRTALPRVVRDNGEGSVSSRATGCPSRISRCSSSLTIFGFRTVRSAGVETQTKVPAAGQVICWRPHNLRAASRSACNATALLAEASTRYQCQTLRSEDEISRS
jgi:hypothetical protein